MQFIQILKLIFSWYLHNGMMVLFALSIILTTLPHTNRDNYPHQYTIDYSSIWDFVYTIYDPTFGTVDNIFLSIKNVDRRLSFQFQIKAIDILSIKLYSKSHYLSNLLLFSYTPGLTNVHFRASSHFTNVNRLFRRVG